MDPGSMDEMPDGVARSASDRGTAGTTPSVKAEVDPMTVGPAAEDTAAVSTASEGIGVPPAMPIATLPPIEPTHRGVRLSPRTGEPRRTGVIVVSQCLLYAAAAAAGAGYAHYWWVAMHVSRFFDSAWVVGWLQPRPGGAASVLLVIGLAACVAAMLSAPFVVAYQAWTGLRATRVFGWTAIGVSLLGILFNPIACLSIPLTATGVGILWQRAAGRYFAQWQRLRTPPEPAPAPEPGDVFYGRLPRFQ
ncbi:hypothetical protein [Propionibacterium sp.]|uniref:hypothetical protein n=1 Tax=Propionibacterium sp. TaxID=1977903 RepID=UPI0039EB188D